jgi:HAD superfamily hydrolase (TIGR01509 family)
MSFKAIIFDCDGVIVDTETIFNNIFQAKLAALGHSLTDQDIQTLFTGYTTEKNLETVTEILGYSLPKIFKSELKAAYQAEMERHLECIPGIPEILQSLNCPFAMATNAHRSDMEFKLAKLGLNQVFTQRFCVEDVKQPKPSPDLYLLASKNLGVHAKDCLVIEDSIAGIKAGVAAGMTVFAFSEQMNESEQLKAGASRCFDSMRELKHQLEKMGLSRQIAI